MSAHLYMLRCADGSYYVGTTRAGLEQRVGEHQAGAFDGFTARRLPVNLVFHQYFERIQDALAAERQVNGWRREKKEALIQGNYALLPVLSRRGAKTATALPPVHPSRRGLGAAPQDEVCPRASSRRA
ncbi:MAG: GIY-YIG nuclease family protein [Stellaceae bacterium]